MNLSQVVLYRYSTSNHNPLPPSDSAQELSYIGILHQTTTARVPSVLWLSCLISVFYIKPQLQNRSKFDLSVVLYRYSTSNHNKNVQLSKARKLSYIGILHQTTTRSLSCSLWYQLSYIGILHQTTTSECIVAFTISCLISVFYIKPQHTG